MATFYQPIFDKFLKRIKEDKDFLNYGSLSDEEIELLVKDHLVNLLNQAIDEVYDNCNPEIDMYDKDDETQQFNVDLVNLEVSLLVNLMYEKFMSEDEVKLKVFQTTFSSSELNSFSPANERKTYMDMLKDIRNINRSKISNYIARDRKTGELKML